MKRFVPLAILLACTAVLRAQEPPVKEAPEAPVKDGAAVTDSSAVKPGHSAHGQAFNEGPRQAAVLMPGTGNIQFPVTTKDELAQKFFTQGVGQLHGFWYFEAERSFRQVAALDPDCAMAYWGMAMANIYNPKRAADFMKLADAKKKTASRREQLWIGAWAAFYGDSKKDDVTKRGALVRALEGLIYEFPDDLEAKAYLVFQLWDNSQHDVPLPSRLAVDALAQQVLAVNPAHPVHHYLIHLWNGADGDKRALKAAANCGQAAPAIAHMWHMPTHTYSNLRRYADAAWQMEASARTDHAHMAEARLMPEQIHNYTHNNDWLAKDLTFIGRVHDAVNLAKNLIELPRLGPAQSQAYDEGRERLLETTVQFEMWRELEGLEGTMYLASNPKTEVEARRLAALGVAWFSDGKVDEGTRELQALEALLDKTRGDRAAAIEALETKSKADEKPAEPAGVAPTGGAPAAAEDRKPEDAKPTEPAKAPVVAERRGPRGRPAAAQPAKTPEDVKKSFAYAISTTEAAIAEVKIYQALAIGRDDDVKPLLSAARDIPAERRARICQAIGDQQEAVKLAQQASNADPAQVQPLANLAAVLWRADKKDAAREAFNKLRPLSAQIDLDCPVFARLAPIAEDLKLPVDWRVPLVVPNDVGIRPDLATLGPMHWQPTAAPAWNLPDSAGKSHALADYRGQPVLVVFYLGSMCSHCIEQLNVLGPLAGQYEAAGIKIIAVSTDSADGLQKTFVQAKDAQGFSFPIVADPEMAAFKAYRAYDDFEHFPLHGTFLIDQEGRVRWQNISYEPFRDVAWLLTESQRLLSVPKAEKKSAASTATETPAPL